jgi:hypothetical protein
VPVAPVVWTAERAQAVRGPCDDVRRAGRNLLVAAGAHVRLRRRRPRHGAHPPVAVRVLLEPTAAVDEPRLEVVSRRRLRGRVHTTAAGTVGAGHTSSVGGWAHNGPSGPAGVAEPSGPTRTDSGTRRGCAEVRREVPCVRHDLRGEPADGACGRARAVPARPRRHGPPAADRGSVGTHGYRAGVGCGAGGGRRLLRRRLLRLSPFAGRELGLRGGDHEGSGIERSSAGPVARCGQAPPDRTSSPSRDTRRARRRVG